MRTQAAPPDDIRTQAATYIDGEHRRVHDDLIHEHRRQEQRMLSWEKSGWRATPATGKFQGFAMRSGYGRLRRSATA